MELDEYLLALRKRWAVIVALALVGGGLGFLYARSITPTYRSSATVFVSVNEGGSAGELVQGSAFVQNSVTSFGRLASMPIVLEPVIEDLGLDTTPRALGKSVSAETPLDTMLLEISTTDTDPARAADISNAVAAQLAVTVQELSPRTAAGDSAIELSITAPAEEPGAPFTPNTRFLTASGIAVGLGLGVALALLLTVLDTRVRTLADLERISGLPVLGATVRSRSAQQAYVTMRSDPTSPRAEAFRRLQANLQYLETGRPLGAIVVTSALSAEGKTSTSINLALAVAEKGGSVLLVDADLRRPAVATALGLEGSAGLTTVLIGRARLDDVVQAWGTDNLHVLPAGDRPPNPSQLLDSAAMHRLLDEAGAAYDLVIIDSPPLLPVIDAAVLGRRTDGVLLVARMRSTRRQQVQAALAALERVGATRLGIVATNVGADGVGPAHGYDYSPPAQKHRLRVRRRRRAQPLGTPVPADPVGTTPVAAPDPGPAPMRASHVSAVLPDDAADAEDVAQETGASKAAGTATEPTDRDTLVAAVRPEADEAPGGAGDPLADGDPRAERPVRAARAGEHSAS